MPDQEETRLSPKEFMDEVKHITTEIAKLLFNDLYPAGIGDHEFQILSALSKITANILIQMDTKEMLQLYLAQLTQEIEAIEKGEGIFIHTRSEN